MGVTQLLFVSGASSEFVCFFEKVAWGGGKGVQHGASGSRSGKVAGRGRVTARPRLRRERLRVVLRGPGSGSDSRRIDSAAL